MPKLRGQHSVDNAPDTWLGRLTDALPAITQTAGVFQSLEFAWELQRVSQSVVDVSPFAHMHWAAPVSFARLVVIDEADRLKMAGLERRV